MNDDKTKCLEKVMSLLMRREYSEKMIYDKCIKKYSEEVIKDTLSFCKEQNYLNDNRFVGSYIRTTLKLKNAGFYRIFDYLKIRGISLELFKEIWYSMDIDEYYYLEKAVDSKIKTLKYKDDFEQKVKLHKFLISRGFRKSTINNFDFSSI